MNEKLRTRRHWLATAAAATASITVGTRLQRAVAEGRASGLKVGMCDWSLKREDTSAFELAKQIGLDGVEVSIGTTKNNLWLRRPEIQKQYIEVARQQGLAIPSVAMGVLTSVPLISEPRAALWTDDTIEVAKNLGAKVVLLAFFEKGEIGENDARNMQRAIQVLAELAPRAEKAGVTLAIESYLSAEAHLKIINAVKSKSLQVYYDVFNAAHAKHDVLKEIKLLGREHIRQVHFKDQPSLENGSGSVHWPAVVAALHEIGYSGWAVLETPSPNDVVADTKKNLAYLRRLFAEKP